MKLVLGGKFLDIPVTFTSLGKVKTLEINGDSDNKIQIVFEDSALTQIEEMKFETYCFKQIGRIVKSPQHLSKVTIYDGNFF